MTPSPLRAVCALPVFLALLAASAFAVETPRTWQFDLTALTAADTFNAELGYGFDLGTAPDAVANTPFYFSVAVPEGNYRVSVTFGDPHAPSVNTVKAESRQLLLERLATAPGEFVTRSFIVNVRTPRLPPPEKNAPGGTAVLLNEREQGLLRWDDKLTLEFSGASSAGSTPPDATATRAANEGSSSDLSAVASAKVEVVANEGPHVRAIRIESADVPTVFLAGDSTVTDQPHEPAASWGQMLPRFFQPTVAIANHAESGETLKSFISALRLAKILSQLRPGDYLFIQFGHNDQKSQWPQTYVDAHTTYRAYLRAYIAEARLRGATPVLVTSMQRRNFVASGRIKNTLGEYPAAVREVAREENVALVDLERMSIAFYEALGPERARLAFNNGGKDPTHHNNYGAYELAQCVAQAIRDANLPLAAQLADDFTGFDPTQPDAPESFALPASPARSSAPLRGN